MSLESDNCFYGKRVLVTGGNRGIGLEIARALYKKGAHVVIFGRDQAKLDEAALEMPTTETAKVDLSDWEATATATRKVLPIDYLVNNAGNSVSKPFGQFDEQDFQSIFAVHFGAVLNISQIVTNEWRGRGYAGSIVNISSLAAIRSFPGLAVYSSAKSALDGLTRHMALELGPSKIRVNSVNPTIVWTEMAEKLWSDPAKRDPLLNRTPLGKFAECEDVVKATLFLLSNDSASTTGLQLTVDNGLALN